MDDHKELLALLESSRVDELDQRAAAAIRKLIAERDDLLRGAQLMHRVFTEAAGQRQWLPPVET